MKWFVDKKKMKVEVIFEQIKYDRKNRKRNKNIRLATKFLRFFQKFYFYFLTSTVQLAFSYICTTTIYDLSPTLWQR